MRQALERLVLALLLGSSAEAHIASNAFVSIDAAGRELQGSIELSIRDAELAVGIDADHDGKITWGELRASAPRLTQYLAEHLLLGTRGRACALQFRTLQVNDRVDGAYAWLPFTARCVLSARELDIRYTVLDGVDPSHRALLSLRAGTVVQSGVLGGARGALEFDLAAPARLSTFVAYLQAGIRHIWSGIDHLLFLLSLLLPAVLLRRHDQWLPVPSARPALLSTLKVVTAFTLAHSITLSLAALNVVRLPSRLTESVIAASIIIAALNNVFPIVTDTRARIAFAFGLLHGFGFASVLADMGLPHGARLLSLCAFNLGIEIGQLAVVLAVMPVVYWLRNDTRYRRALLPWGSVSIAAVASVWLIQRALLSGS